MGGYRDMILDKIRDIRVRDLVAAGSPGDVDVLVELDLPVKPLRVSRDLLGTQRPAFVLGSDPDPDRTDAFEQFGAFLRTRSSGEPTALPGAHAYVVTVPASRLLEILESPLVSSVVANRRMTHGPLRN